MIHQLSSSYGSDSIKDPHGPAHKIWLLKRHVYNTNISKKYDLGKTMDLFNEKSVRRIPRTITDSLRRN